MKQVRQQQKTATRQVRRFKLKEMYPVFFHNYKQFLTRINPRLLQFGYALRIDLHTVKNSHSSAGVAVKFRLYRRTDEILSRAEQKPLPNHLRQFFSEQKYTRVNLTQSDTARSYLSGSLHTLWHRLKHLKPMARSRSSLSRASGASVCVSRVPSVDSFPHTVLTTRGVQLEVHTEEKRQVPQLDVTRSDDCILFASADERLALQGLCALNRTFI
jgi:hypothetical protein